jgi:CRISPR type IV-associated protein Csf1
MFSLSDLICSARAIDPPKGNLPGICVFCGHSTEHGHKPSFSDSFCNAPLLSGGSVVCPACKHMSGGKTYRNSMWMVSEHEFRFFKREHARQILLTPPEPPFAIYLTRTYKKTGWQAMMRLGCVNESRERFLVGFDYDTILVDVERLKDHLTLVDELRAKDIHKPELESGHLSPRALQKLDLDITLMNRLKELAGDPLWTLAVYVA